MDKQPVYVWGLSVAELAAWPPDLLPQPDPALPADRPVVVSAATAADFSRRAAAYPFPDGRCSDAILYLSAATAIPQGANFNAVVPEGEWRLLRRLLACPQQFRAAELADEVPLEQLTRPVEVLDLATLGGLDELRDHLRTCTTCAEALREALRARLRIRRAMYCPSAARLIGYIKGSGEVTVARHLDICPLCRAQVSALRPIVDPAAVWADFAFTAPTEATFVRGLLDAVLSKPKWQPAAATRREQQVQQRRPAADELLANLQAGTTVVLRGPQKQLNLCWDDAQGVPFLTLEGRSNRAIDAFRLEFRKGEQVLWCAESAAGRLLLPPEELAEALQRDYEHDAMDDKGAYKVVILAAD